METNDFWSTFPNADWAKVFLWKVGKFTFQNFLKAPKKKKKSFQTLNDTIHLSVNWSMISTNPALDNNLFCVCVWVGAGGRDVWALM